MADNTNDDKLEKPLALGPTGETVRANIARRRTELGMGYTELSEKLKGLHRRIPPLGLRRIENGARRVDADDLVVLALVLGVSPLALLLPTEKGPLTAGGPVYTPEEIWAWAHGERPLSGDYVEAITFLRDSNPLHWALMEKVVRERGFESVDDAVQKMAAQLVDRGYTLATKPTDEREQGTDGDDK